MLLLLSKAEPKTKTETERYDHLLCAQGHQVLGLEEGDHGVAHWRVGELPLSGAAAAQGGQCQQLGVAVGWVVGWLLRGFSRESNFSH